MIRVCMQDKSDGRGCKDRDSADTCCPKPAFLTPGFHTRVFLRKKIDKFIELYI